MLFLFFVFTTLLSFLGLLAGEQDPQIQQPQQNKFCLTMIVKNESKIIERCLNKVKDIIDCISICDTGSTDNTKEIIEQFMQKNKIPGKVHQHKWKNFGYNRTLSVQAARHMLQELGYPLQHTYFLLLDADMLLEVDPTFSKDDLLVDSYSIRQKSGDISYYNVRLMRTSLPWQCVGVTHEFWCFQLPTYTAQEAQLNTLWIDDQGDGGCKSDKFERDIMLLTQGLKDEPTNERYMFYLAQSYKCLQRYDEAIRWYKARIEKGGWKEEVWYSKFMLGEIYEEMGFWDQALHWYLDAYEHNPERSETLQKIATHYRLNRENDLAYLFAKQGSRIPYPKDQVLFISDPVYHYQFDEEMSIAAYYIPSGKEEGFEAADRLTHKKNIPQDVKCQAYKNLLFYVQPLKNADFYPIEFKEGSKETEDNKTVMSDDLGDDFSHLRSSAAPIEFDEGYLMLVHELVEDNTLHRFLYLDQELHPKQMSRPFTFKQKGIEYCTAIALDDSKKKCLIPIRINKQAWICSVDVDTIRALLKPLPKTSS
jgi:glycosyltransferase involved in cell wall biosynthesis